MKNLNYISILVVSCCAVVVSTSIQAPFCRKDHFQCRNSKCIPKRWLCDKESDCSDGSDEIGCNITACNPLNDFQCSNGKCIPKSWKCDGQIDCSFDGSDSSDESQCNEKECYFSQFTCSKSKTCIPLSWKCDNVIDCQDGSDEKNCVGQCSEGEFTCKNGRCIDRMWRCDFENDCGDKSDEQGCAKVNTNCSARQFQCSNKFCIPSNWVCDGDNDCRDESDEKVLTCKGEFRKTKCDLHHFQCKSSSPNIFSSCVIMKWRCDGVRDCIDGSDEENCDSNCLPPNNCSALNSGRGGLTGLSNGTKVNCSSDEFACGGKTLQCINISRVCDGNLDCSNGADESKYCNVNECTNGTHYCSQKCIDLKIGYKCDCFEGFRMDENGFTCNDIDECSTFGRCSQHCVNTKGSFKCLCARGYQLVNKTYCKVKGSKMFFLFPEKSTIRMLKFEKTMHLHSVVADLNGAVGLTYDFNHGYLYWSDMKEKSISRIKVFGEHRRESLVVRNIGSVEGLAVDWLAKNLYWVDSKRNMVEVSNLDGKHRTDLISTGMNQPRNLVLDPRKGHRFLYFSTWGETGQIERLSMDGDPSSLVLFYQRDGSWPNCLCIDFVLDILFWIDPKRSTIESLSIHNSSYHRVVYKTQENHVYGLAVFEDFVYWTDWLTGAIHRVNKFYGGEETKLIKFLYRPMAIAAYHHMLQPAASNPCARVHCSHLCLLSSSKKGYKCSCGKGVTLLPDGVTCNVNDSSICHEGYCLSSGTCQAKHINNVWKASCICPEEYEGSRCEKKKELLKPIYQNGIVLRYECMHGYCLNGGTCHETAHNKSIFRPYCQCQRNFYGKRCALYTNLFDEDLKGSKKPSVFSEGELDSTTSHDLEISVSSNKLTTVIVVGFSAGVVTAFGVFAAMSFYLQRQSSTRVYHNPRYNPRGTVSSEEDTQLQTLNEEMNSEI